MNHNRNIYKILFWILLLSVILILLCSFDLVAITTMIPFLKTLYNNLVLISSTITKILPIVTILLIILILISSRWIFRIERLSIGGINVLFNHPDEIFKQQLKNFLNTKRTLFDINVKKDNFYETFNSYYETYKFIRDEMRIFSPKHSSKSEIYRKSEEIIKLLNSFLTTHHNNYRRWYDYIISNNTNSTFDIDIEDIQKQYRHYNELVNDFKSINKSFIDYAKLLKINYEKWGQ